MIYAFVGLVFVGLIAAVRVMLYGVERQRAAGDDRPRSFSASPALIATFCFVAGIAGYACMRFGVSTSATWMAAIGLGAVATYAASQVIAAWWTVVPEHDVDDERYVLQGSLGRVVAAIGSNTAGGGAPRSAGGEKKISPRRVARH